VDDAIKPALDDGASLCNRPLGDWLAEAGLKPADVWDAKTPDSRRSLWNAKLFPLLADDEPFEDWLWMHTPGQASDAQVTAFRDRRRYSFADMAILGDVDAFNARRTAIRAEQVRRSLHWTFGPESDFSATDLAMMFERFAPAARSDWTAALLNEAWWNVGREGGPVGASFAFSRILH
jgi:hypothetical protein